MIISEKDKKESEKVGQLIKRIENIDELYVNTESNIIYQKQPFLISLLLGYRLDLKEAELEEIMKIVFLIWEFFKDFKLIRENKISESQFNRIQQRNIHMLKYLEGEQGENAKLNLIASDLIHLRSKELLTGIIFQFNNKKELLSLNNSIRGKILIGIKSLIESFEEIIKEK